MRADRTFVSIVAFVMVLTGCMAFAPASVLAQESDPPGALQASIVEEISLIALPAFTWSMTGETWTRSGSGNFGSLALINIPVGTYTLTIQPPNTAVPPTSTQVQITSSATATITVVVDMGADSQQTAPWLDLTVTLASGEPEPDDGYSYFILNQSNGTYRSGFSEWGTTRVESLLKGSYSIAVQVDTERFVEPESVYLEVEGGQTYSVPMVIADVPPPAPPTSSFVANRVGNADPVAVGASATFTFDLVNAETALSGVTIDVYRSDDSNPLTSCAVGSLATNATASCPFVFSPLPTDAGSNVTFQAIAQLNEWPEPITSTSVSVSVSEAIGSSIADPAIELAQTRSDPGSTVAFSIVGYPEDTAVGITWRTQFGVELALGTIQTNASGAADGNLTIPAAPGGPGHTITFTSGTVSTAVVFEIAPRISPNVTSARRGDTISINLRGFARFDTVQIRWKNGAGAFVPVGSATTSSTGSVTNLPIVVPAWAPGGLNTLRVDGLISQQSSRVTITNPGVSLGQSSGIVGSVVTFTGDSFASNVTVSMTWLRPGGGSLALGSVTSNASGAFAGSFTVPATPGGPDQIIRFSSPGGVTVDHWFELEPRIMFVGPTPGRGATTDLSLRGFAKKESIQVEWWNPAAGQWVVVATGETSNSGSANLIFQVPIFAPNGANLVRVTTASFTVERNDLLVNGGWEY
jgi:hypothetical protein